MKTFKEFTNMQPEDEFSQDMDMQQDDDLKALKKLIDDYNEYAPQNNIMSVSQDRDSDAFTLYVGPDEITTGSVPELIARVKQIRHEHGF